jgi:hypothetical protein
MCEETSLVETEKYRNHTIEVHYDSDPSNPRTDWDNLGTFITFGNRYTSPDEHNYRTEDYGNLDELTKAIKNKEDIAIMLPVYRYEHGNVAYSTGSFNDSWDSGQCGFIFISKKKAREEYNWKNLTKKRLEQLEKMLKHEVEIFSQWANGNVYGFICKDENGEEIEDGSCWGFFGYDHKASGLLDESKSTIKHTVLYNAKELGKKKLAEFKEHGIQQAMEI